MDGGIISVGGHRLRLNKRLTFGGPFVTGTVAAGATIGISYAGLAPVASAGAFQLKLLSNQAFRIVSANFFLSDATSSEKLNISQLAMILFESTSGLNFWASTIDDPLHFLGGQGFYIYAPLSVLFFNSDFITQVGHPYMQAGFDVTGNLINTDAGAAHSFSAQGVWIVEIFDIVEPTNGQ